MEQLTLDLQLDAEHPPAFPLELMQPGQHCGDGAFEADIHLPGPGFQASDMDTRVPGALAQPGRRQPHADALLLGPMHDALQPGRRFSFSYQGPLSLQQSGLPR